MSREKQADKNHEQMHKGLTETTRQAGKYEGTRTDLHLASQLSSIVKAYEGHTNRWDSQLIKATSDKRLQRDRGGK